MSESYQAPMAAGPPDERQPLWEVMRRAYDVSPPVPVDADLDWIDRHGYAGEIRALRDWLVPEESEPAWHLANGDVNPQWDRWKERQRLRALLTAEADRAERGDG